MKKFFRSLFVFLGVTLTAGSIACGIAYVKNDDFKNWVHDDVLKIEQKVEDTSEKDEAIETLTTELAKSNASLEDATLQLEAKQEALTNAQSDLAEATSNLNTALEEKAVLEAKVESLQINIEELEVELETSESNSETLTLELNTTRTALATAEEELEEKTAEIESLTTDIESIQSEIGTLETDVETINTNIENIQSEITAINSSLTNLTERVNALENSESTGSSSGGVGLYRHNIYMSWQSTDLFYKIYATIYTTEESEYTLTSLVQSGDILSSSTENFISCTGGIQHSSNGNTKMVVGISAPNTNGFYIHFIDINGDGVGITKSVDYPSWSGTFTDVVTQIA